jgi:hypothetical protein
MDRCDARGLIYLWGRGRRWKKSFIEGVAPVVNYIPPVVSYFTVV